MRSLKALSAPRRGRASACVTALLAAALLVPLALSMPLRAEEAAPAPAPSAGPAAPALADQPARSGPEAGAADDGLTPPPVVDPKSVETRPVSPGSASPFVREDVLASVPVLSFVGTAKWDDAYDALVAAMKALDAELKALGLARAGDVMVAYTGSDDDGFSYEVQVPFSGVTTKKPSGGMKLGASFGGKVLRFAHTGAFTDMDNTYEMIANYLDEKNISADEVYLEQYRTDLVTTAPDALKIDILIPVP